MKPGLGKARIQGVAKFCFRPLEKNGVRLNENVRQKTVFFATKPPVWSAAG